ncbi:hypothetical protein NLG97_g1729 [Lecanicillium saksenae]|uniref:Uncharacterized protein n=1 Tax=Lecanicillium saksenae TaxID=468837 RepID=A0ACC1R4T9_9HYPO|nr:hypothetical protein NLG97_g1729 [Lecanicillium saksenae]
MRCANTINTFIRGLLLLGSTAAQLRSVGLAVPDHQLASLQRPLGLVPKAIFTRKKLQAPKLCPSYGESQWTGSITVSDQRDLFYWYFDSRNDPEHDPIIVAFPGGPGGSGVLLALGANGPCLLEEGESRPNAWSFNNNASILFLDQPSGTGFSRLANGAPLLDNDQDAAKDFQRFLQLFFSEAFPEKRHLPLHIYTASYGGHYGPVYLHHILESRRHGSDVAFWGDIRSLTLHDPQIDWMATFVGTYPFLCDNKETAGLLNETACEFIADNMPEQKRLGHGCHAAYNGGSECRAAYNHGVEVIQAPYTDLRLDLGDFHRKCPEGYSYPICKQTGIEVMEKFMNQDWVKKDLRMPLDSRFIALNMDIWNAFHESGSWHTPTTKELIDVLDAYKEEQIGNIKVMILNGNWDVIINTQGNLWLSDRLTWSGQSDFRSKQLQPLPEGLGITGAWKATKDGNFAFVAVDGVGHFPSGAQSEVLTSAGTMRAFLSQGLFAPSAAFTIAVLIITNALPITIPLTTGTDAGLRDGNAAAVARLATCCTLVLAGLVFLNAPIAALPQAFWAFPIAKFFGFEAFAFTFPSTAGADTYL